MNEKIYNSISEKNSSSEPIQRLESIKRIIKKNTPKTATKPITLVVVTKNFSAQQVKPLLECHLDFGENRVQEACEKWREIKQKIPRIKLHAIGSIQTNKAIDAVNIFDCIHTIDRTRIAKALAQAMLKTNKNIPCFIQVNLAQEKQKAGVHIEKLEELIYECTKIYKLQINGLMCIPPKEHIPAPYFAMLAKLAEKYKLHGKSMGMSNDFEDAIELGATHLRIGSAIMGKRI